MPKETNGLVVFSELENGDALDPCFTHITEEGRNRFPDRPVNLYIKTGSDRILWLNGGIERSIMPNAIVRRKTIVITERR